MVVIPFADPLLLRCLDGKLREPSGETWREGFHFRPTDRKNIPIGSEPGGFAFGAFFVLLLIAVIEDLHFNAGRISAALAFFEILDGFDRSPNEDAGVAPGAKMTPLGGTSSKFV